MSKLKKIKGVVNLEKRLEGVTPLALLPCEDATRMPHRVGSGAQHSPNLLALILGS